MQTFSKNRLVTWSCDIPHAESLALSWARGVIKKLFIKIIAK